MKKLFSFLLAIMLLAVMLTGCGMDNRDGHISVTDRPRETSFIPESPAPEPSTTPGRNGPEYDEDEMIKVSPNVTDTVR